ncbi:uncharacterized protein MYCFIDRAFT_176258 [Pseudocercospora fijiensis CIRAD86]|uniref:Uncharacterized protein n=1 Tax=Pseudocercospora fijiensis (strain CIRAD86) TaxID=383855 RepID=M3ATU1_PSEFD|nr:uncharacterized protein MYCFIDRAFT_176258 [Pseudocercospora fijiensis CIRAD86]EME80902.1 hypothetical protein MYCFIDRAFT_176258 [Pseudocercospora fijiensis CIRAD86]
MLPTNPCHFQGYQRGSDINLPRNESIMHYIRRRKANLRPRDVLLWQDDLEDDTQNGACWPTELLLRDHLCFVIRQEGSGWATECLYSLFSFLRCNSTALKTVTFVCSGTSFLSKDWYKSSLVHKVHYDNMLYPIARFCAKFKVQFENFPASIPGAVQALVDKHSDLLKVDISVRGEIMGKLLAHDEILTTMLLHHLPDAHALYTDLKNDYHSALDSLDLAEVCERRMKEVMDKFDDFLNDRDMVALMRRGERIIGGYSQGLAEEFWKYDHARRQLSSGQDLPVALGGLEEGLTGQLKAPVGRDCELSIEMKPPFLARPSSP